MKAPLSWLRELVEIDLDLLPVATLARRLTMAGLEVEAVHRVGADWQGVALARIVDLEPHPRADSLQVARLDRGGRTATVVSAAPNLRVGAVVPHVTPGGRLPGGEVSSRAFRGITSEGMLCSGDELGISPDKDGIYLFEDTAPVGSDLETFLGETVLDVYVTPNRPDCMSIVGIAREVSALFGAPLRLPHAEPPRGRRPVADLVSVRIEDSVGCPRFTASVVQGVTIGPSPQPLQRRLYLAGVRPISNVVDVTNYVMLELGQPLHAFDRARLEGGIVVRRAAPGERLTTLDGEQRSLGPDMLVVADERRARSLAGIMGGQDSEISPDTRDVVLEGASWDRATIRLTSSALNLSSEASRRFGRGIDPDLTGLAVSRATELTVQLAGGEPADGLVDPYPGQSEPPSVRLDPSRVDKLLGTRVLAEQQLAVLRSLGFGVEPTSTAAYTVRVPGHRRFDVEHVADLAEEVGRVVGYEAIPATVVAGRAPEPRPDGDAGYSDELRARRALAAAGLHEAMTYTLVDPAWAGRLDAAAAEPGQRGEIAVANPLSSEQSVLRASLLPSLLEAARANLRHRDRVLLFELARTWHGALELLPDEERHVGLVLAGPRDEAYWGGSSEPLDFYDLKGVVEALLRAFQLRATFSPAPHPPLHPGRSASVLVGGQPLGFAGQLHPRVAERFGLEERAVLVAELSFERLVAARAVLDEPVVAPPRFPAAERDVSLVVDESVSHAAVEQVLRAAGAPLVASVRLFDVYQGDQIGAGRKSLAYALSYQAADRTLGDEEVTSTHARVEQALRHEVGAEIRGRD